MAMSTRSRIGYFWVLLEGSFALKADGASECVLRQQRSRVVNMQQSCTLDQRVADRAHHYDRPARLPRLRDKRSDVERGDGARFANIRHRLGHAAEPRRARRASGKMRGGGRIVQAAEHLPDHGAPLVANQVKHVADLKVAEALHQPRKQEHAGNDHDPDEQHREQRDLC